MDIWNRYVSPSGYHMNDDGTDSLGVNHSNFSLRDEIAYQMNRVNNEEQQQSILPQASATIDQPPTPWRNGTVTQAQTSTSWSDGYSNSLNNSQSNLSTLDNVQNFAQNVANTVAPYIPTYYVGYGIGTAQNMIPHLKKDLIKAYNVYRNNGLYSVGKKYAEPSVRKALQVKEVIAPLEISDVNKHQYVSCVGSTDGLLATAETLAGGIYKELQDTKDKLTNPKTRSAYGGTVGVFADAGKDLVNDFIGSSTGYIAGRKNVPEICNDLLYNPIRIKR